MNADVKTKLAFIYVEAHASECKSVRELYDLYKKTIVELEQIHNEQPKKRQMISY